MDRLDFPTFSNTFCRFANNLTETETMTEKKNSEIEQWVNCEILFGSAVQLPANSILHHHPLLIGLLGCACFKTRQKVAVYNKDHALRVVDTLQVAENGTLQAPKMVKGRGEMGTRYGVVQLRKSKLRQFINFLNLNINTMTMTMTLWLWVYDSVIQWFSEVILDSQSQWSKTYALAALSDRNKKQKEILTRIRGLICRTVENMDKCCNSPGVAWASAIRKWTCCVCANCLTLFASHRWPMKNHESWSHEPWTLNLRNLKILNAFFLYCTLYIV